MNNLLVIEWISFNSIELYNGFFVAALSHLNFDLHSVLILFSFNLVTVSINDADLIATVVNDLREFQDVGLITNQFLLLVVR